MVRNSYKDFALWDAERKALTFITQIVSTCGGFREARCRMQENGTYDESPYEIE